MENNNINSFLQQAITKACSSEPLTQEIIITNLIIALNKLIIKLNCIDEIIHSNGYRIEPAKLFLVNAMLEMTIEKVNNITSVLK